MGTDCGHRPRRDVIMIAHFRKTGQKTRESGTSSEEGNVVAKCRLTRHLQTGTDECPFIGLVDAVCIQCCREKNRNGLVTPSARRHRILSPSRYLSLWLWYRSPLEQGSVYYCCWGVNKQMGGWHEPYLVYRSCHRLRPRSGGILSVFLHETVIAAAAMTAAVRINLFIVLNVEIQKSYKDTKSLFFRYCSKQCVWDRGIKKSTDFLDL